MNATERPFGAVVVVLQVGAAGTLSVLTITPPGPLTSAVIDETFPATIAVFELSNNLTVIAARAAAAIVAEALTATSAVAAAASHRLTAPFARTHAPHRLRRSSIVSLKGFGVFKFWFEVLYLK